MCWRFPSWWPACSSWACNCRSYIGSGFASITTGRPAATGMMRIGRTITPMLFGLAVTQINTFTDSLIAWGLAASPGGPARIPGLAGPWRYPLRQGAAAAIYYGERMYQFPLGIVGLAVAASIFPLLSRHAAHGRPRPAGRRPDAGAAAGAVSERAGGRGLDRAGPSVGQTALPARQLHRGRHRSGRRG